MIIIVKKLYLYIVMYNNTYYILSIVNNNYI